MTYQEVQALDLVAGDKAEINQVCRTIVRIRATRLGDLETLHASLEPTQGNCYDLHYAFLPETQRVWVIRK